MASFKLYEVGSITQTGSDYPVHWSDQQTVSTEKGEFKIQKLFANLKIQIDIWFNFLYSNFESSNSWEPNSYEIITHH